VKTEGCAKQHYLNFSRILLSTMSDEWEPIFEGCYEGQLKVVKQRLDGKPHLLNYQMPKYGLDLGYYDYYYYDDLADADYLDAYDYLCKGDTLLHVASRWGHVDIVQYLIDCGSDPTIKNEHGQSPVETLTENTQTTELKGYDPFKYRGDRSNRNRLLSILTSRKKNQQQSSQTATSSRNQQQQSFQTTTSSRYQQQQSSQTATSTLMQFPIGGTESIFEPTCKEALIISCSEYKSGFGMERLSSPKNDGLKMRQFLEEQCGFEDVKLKTDKDLKMIEKEFDDLINFSSTLSRSRSKCLFFIYYSGHGTMKGPDTYGHTVFGEPFNLDEKIRKLSLSANTYVISILDCCRKIVESKSPSTTNRPADKVTFGQSLTIYAVKPGQSADSFKSQELSPLTKRFIEHMSSSPARTDIRQLLLAFQADLNFNCTLGLYLK